MRSFALVLLRRFLSRSSLPPITKVPDSKDSHPTLYDSLSSDAVSAIQDLILRSFSHEPTSAVRRASVETTTALLIIAWREGDRGMHFICRHSV